MSDALVELVWGDGLNRFALHIGHLRELQEKCKAGPQRILQRLSSLDWQIDDIRETIRLGLIGGGKTPSEAHTLAVRYFDERPPLESRPVAQVILMQALVGVPDDVVGKAEAETAPTNPESTPTEGSPSPPSTDGEPS
jgi:hypothetical protein